MRHAEAYIPGTIPQMLSPHPPNKGIHVSSVVLVQGVKSSRWGTRRDLITALSSMISMYYTWHFVCLVLSSQKRAF